VYAHIYSNTLFTDGAETFLFHFAALQETMCMNGNPAKVLNSGLSNATGMLAAESSGLESFKL
jgi:hypothetical protein